MAPLGGWVGYGVERWRHEDRSGRRWLVIALEPLPGVPRRCSGYGATIEAVHDRSQRRIRDLPEFDAAVELQVPRLRLACPTRGPRLEHLDWLGPHARGTQRLAESVARLCDVLAPTARQRLETGLY